MKEWCMEHWIITSILAAFCLVIIDGIQHNFFAAVIAWRKSK